LARSKKTRERMSMKDQLDEVKDSHFLPPRSSVHPSQKGKVAKIFYQILLFIFILLVIGLTYWGIQFTAEP